jgi:predicted MFS family arabinose efflux permease
MASVCPEPVRAKGFVLNRLANNLGATIGPVAGGLLARHDYRYLFWVDGGTCLVAAVLLWRLFPGGPSRRSPGQPARARSPWAIDVGVLGLLASTVLLSLVIAQVFSAFAPYVRASEGLPELAIGMLLAVNTVLIVAVQMPLIHAVQGFPRTRAACAGGLLFAAGFGMMPLHRGVLFLAFTVAVWTFGEMLAFPSVMTAMSLRAPPGAQGRYLGLHSLAFSLGMTAGPALGARLVDARGFPALWLAVAAVALAAAAILGALPPSSNRAAPEGG